MPTNCDICVKPLSNFLRPPPAFECRRKFSSTLSHFCMTCSSGFQNFLKLLLGGSAVITLPSAGCRMRFHRDHLGNDTIPQCKRKFVLVASMFASFELVLNCHPRTG